jgi:hypothetical protein
MSTRNKQPFAEREGGLGPCLVLEVIAQALFGVSKRLFGTALLHGGTDDRAIRAMRAIGQYGQCGDEPIKAPVLPALPVIARHCP